MTQKNLPKKFEIDYEFCLWNLEIGIEEETSKIFIQVKCSDFIFNNSYKIVFYNGDFFKHSLCPVYETKNFELYESLVKLIENGKCSIR